MPSSIPQPHPDMVLSLPLPLRLPGVLAAVVFPGPHPRRGPASVPGHPGAVLRGGRGQGEAGQRVERSCSQLLFKVGGAVAAALTVWLYNFWLCQCTV